MTGRNFKEIPDRFNMADYFLYDRIDEGMGGRTALRTEKEELTYEEVVTVANKIGNALRHLNMRPEDRVLIGLNDTPEFVATIFGALRIGGVVAMVNPLLTPEELRYYLEYTRARFFVCTQEVAQKVKPFALELATLEGIIVVGDEVVTGGLFHSYLQLTLEESKKLDPHKTHRDDPAFWLFTSGSTGKPKANIHQHGDFPWNCERYAKATVGYTGDDVTLSVPKLFFGYATGSNLFFPFAVGGTACLFPERATAEVMFQKIEQFSPTLLVSVPTMVLAMAQHPRRNMYTLSGLRAVFSAGEALPVELYKQWKQAFRAEILDGIGSAELFHIYITNKPGDVTPGSLGKLVPGYEARIIGPDGNDVAPGETGTLLVHGHSAASGYFQAAEKTRETFLGNDWVRSADLFRQDADGRFWYAGRSDDILKVGGIFVSPIEIEDCLLGHTAVAECAVIPYHESGLEKPMAVVVTRSGHEPGAPLALELAKHVKSKIAPYKFPRRVRFVDTLPKNDRGKVERKRLREELGAQSLEGSFDTDPSG